MKFFIASNNNFEAEGIKKILQEQNMDILSGITIEDIIQAQPDILVMDIDFLETEFEQIKKLEQINFNIMLMLNNKQELLYRFIFTRFKISACLLKNSSITDFISAINKINANGCYLVPELKNYLFIAKIGAKSYLKIHTKQNNARLTTRELEVLKMIATGKNNLEIADTLFLSEKTVKNHLTSIFKKLKVTDRTQALIYALKNNLVSLI